MSPKMVLCISFIILASCAATQRPVGKESAISSQGGSCATALVTYHFNGAIDSLAWSPDSLGLAVQTKPGLNERDGHRKIFLLDINRKLQRTTLFTTTDPIFSVTYWPDASRIGCLIWSDSQNEARVLAWDPKTGDADIVLDGATCSGIGMQFESDGLALTVSQDGRYVAAGTKLVATEHNVGSHIGGEICVWDAHTGERLWIDRTTHTDSVYAVAFTDDGRMLASAGKDKLIRLWDARTGRLERTLIGVGYDGVCSISWSPDGTRLASGGLGREEGGKVRLWDTASGQQLELLTRGAARFHKGSNVRVAFAPGEDILYALGQTDSNSDTARWCVLAWNVGTGQFKGKVVQGSGYARTMAIAPDQQYIAVGTYEGELFISPSGH